MLPLSSTVVRIANQGRQWHIEFEPSKSNALYVSLKHDVEEHPTLFMNGVLIKKSKVLSILGFHFDSSLTWGYNYDRFHRTTLQTEVGMS